MKGFIEVTQIDDVNKKSDKILININNIICMPEYKEQNNGNKRTED